MEYKPVRPNAYTPTLVVKATDFRPRADLWMMPGPYAVMSASGDVYEWPEDLIKRMKAFYEQT